MDTLHQFTGHFLELDSATVGRLRKIAEKKGTHTQEIALQLLRDGIEAEELVSAESVGTYFDTLIEHGADYLMELHVFAGRDGEPEDIHLLRHASGHFLKAWKETEEFVHGDWQPYRHGLGTPSSRKRHRHCYQEISWEEGIRLVYENAIPKSLQSNIVMTLKSLGGIFAEKVRAIVHRRAGSSAKADAVQPAADAESRAPVYDAGPV